MLKRLCFVTVLVLAALVGLLKMEVWADIVVNEVMPRATDDAKNEYIELYNTGPGPSDVANWRFSDGDASDTIVAGNTRFAPGNDTGVAGYDTTTTVIGVDRYAVILDPDYVKGARPYNFPVGTIILSIIPNDVLGGGALETGDTITLSDSVGVTISTYGVYAGGPIWPTTNHSVERIDPDWLDVACNWAENTTSDSTPGAVNSVDADYTGSDPTAKFGVDNNPDSECHTFVFTDNSDSDGCQNITVWAWDFGDGIGTSALQNPAPYQYTNDGNYTCTLTVTDAGGDTSDTTMQITVNKANPVARFGVDSNPDSECHTFVFTDNSDSDGCQNITVWAWDFGDGIGTSALQNPAPYQYTNDGNYTCTLTVTDAGGDTSDTTMQITVNKANPVAKFGVDSNPDSECHTFVFTDNSDSDGCQNITVWAWDFGDGIGTSAAQNPTYQYTNDGNYTCTLTVTDSGGDTSDTQLVITTTPVKPTANAGNDTTSSTFTVAFDGSGTTDGCQSIDTYTWDFGDGDTGTGQSTTHTYSSAGTYPVTLTVTDSGGDTDSDTITVVISPLAGQTGGSLYGPGSMIVWQDSRNGNYDVYLYDIGPNGRYENGGGDDVGEFQITSDGSHQQEPDIWLRTDTEAVIVWTDFRNSALPDEDDHGDIYFRILDTTGGWPGTLDLETRVTTNPWHQGEPVVCGDTIVYTTAQNGSSGLDLYYYNRITGDSGPLAADSGNQSNADIFGDTVVYQSDEFGDEDLYLIHTDGSGKIAIPGLPAGRQTNPAIDSKDGRYVAYQSNASGNWDIYVYDFITGITTPVAISANDEENPSVNNGKVAYQKKEGLSSNIFVYYIQNGKTYQITNKTGFREATKPTIYDPTVACQERDDQFDNWEIAFYTLGHPIAKFTVNSTSNTECYIFNFTDNSDSDGYQAITNWLWDFGDGIGTSALQNPTYQSNDGNYTCTLTVTDAGGDTSDTTVSITVNPVKPTAKFGVDSTSETECHTFQFNGSSSTTDGCQSIDTYTWDFGDGNGYTSTDGNDSTTPHKYDDNGTYTVKLTVTDSNGDTSDTTAQVVVSSVKPQAKFTVDSYSDSECHTFQFDNNSDSDGCQTLTYLWEFGDGDTSPDTNPTHKYDDDGTYTVKLTVTDNGGDTSDTTAQIIVNKADPVAKFTVDSYSDTQDHPFVFTDDSDSDGCQPLSWSWDFDDDGDTEASGQGPHSHQYGDSGTYTARLTVTDANGDTDDTTTQITVYFDNWKITFPATGSSTSHCTAGVDPAGSDAFDPGLDVPAPPISWGGEYVSVYFNHQEYSDSAKKRLETDIREKTVPLDDFKETWPICILQNINTPGHDIELKKPTLTNVPISLDVVLKDDITGEVKYIQFNGVNLNTSDTVFSFDSNQWLQRCYTLMVSGSSSTPDSPTWLAENRDTFPSGPGDDDGYDTDGTFYVAWAQVVGATQYELQQSPDGGTNWNPVVDADETDTHYTETTGALGTTYEHRVRAIDADGFYSDWITAETITVDSTPPDSPGTPIEGDNACLGTDDDYDTDGAYWIAWSATSDPESGITAYEIQECTGSWNWQSLGITSDTTTNCTCVSGRTDESYYYRVRARNGAGTLSDFSDTSDSITVDITPPDSPTGVIEGDNALSGVDWDGDEDGNYWVAWDEVPDAVSYKVWEGQAGGSWTDAGDTTDTCLRITGKATGTYYYKVTAKDAAGNWGDTSAVSDGISVADITTYCETFGEGWSLISIPVNPTYTDPRDNFPCLNAGTCWLFGYQTNVGYHNDYSLSLGEGYWLGLNEASTVCILGTPLLPETGASYSIPLGAGWNLIGCPYPAALPLPTTAFTIEDSVGTELSLGDALNAGWIPTTNFFEYDHATSNYTPTSTLSPFKGYWFACSIGGAKLNIANITEPSPPVWPSPSLVNKGDLLLEITASCGKARTTSGVGLMDEAKEGLDEKDSLLPPDPEGGDYISFYTSHPEAGAFSRFSRDVRRSPGLRQSKEFEFVVATNLTGEMTLSWDPKEIKGYRAILTDGARKIDMKRASSYSYNSSSGQKTFRVELTETPPDPSKTTLLQNFPNPFNPECWIPFKLSEPAGHVEFRIYTITGQLIRTIDCGRREGENVKGGNKDNNIDGYACYWDGYNNKGQEVASGVYFYQLVADGKPLTKKMVVLK